MRPVMPPRFIMTSVAPVTMTRFIVMLSMLMMVVVSVVMVVVFARFLQLSLAFRGPDELPVRLPLVNPFVVRRTILLRSHGGITP